MCVKLTPALYAGCDNGKKRGKIKDILLVGARNAFEFGGKRDIRLNRNTKCHCEKLMLLDHKPYGPNNFFNTIGFLNIYIFSFPYHLWYRLNCIRQCFCNKEGHFTYSCKGQGCN